MTPPPCKENPTPQVSLPLQTSPLSQCIVEIVKNPQKKTRLLIVEDSDVMRQRLLDIVAEVEGISVVGTAESPGGSIRAIRELKPDVVILDIRLKKGSGLEVLEEIKKRGLKTTVIVCTNYPYSEYRRRCRELGVKYFMEKATGFEKIPRVLKEIMSVVVKHEKSDPLSIMKRKKVA